MGAARSISGDTVVRFKLEGRRRDGEKTVCGGGPALSAASKNEKGTRETESELFTASIHHHFPSLRVLAAIVEPISPNLRSLWLNAERAAAPRQGREMEACHCSIVNTQTMRPIPISVRINSSNMRYLSGAVLCVAVSLSVAACLQRPQANAHD